MEDVVIKLKKPFYPITTLLYEYLQVNGRLAKLDIGYSDLLRFKDSSAIRDKNGKDTLWLNVFYSPADYAELELNLKTAELELNLKKIYTLLHSDGDESSFPYLTIDSIQFCTFGNSKPFRIRVRNILNDNHTNYYIKRVDASRLYGLELEDILSVNRINFLLHQSTLVEEHILGIPGDVFLAEQLHLCSDLEKAQIAKEYVKFNERCFIG